jgi:L-malate glycosyltransferase
VSRVNTDLQRVPVVMMVRELGWGGGIERDVSKYARHLPQFGIDPHVICFTSGGTRFEEIKAAGIPIATLPLTSFRSRSTWRVAIALRRYIMEHGIEIVHAFDLTTDCFATLTRNITRPKAVITSHLWCRDMLDRKSQFALSVSDKLSSALFANCDAVADDLHRNWGVPTRKLHVCHNGYESTEFNPHGRVRPVELKDASVVFGTVAVFREEKNLSMLIDAFAETLATVPKAKLLLVGDGPLRKELEVQVNTRGISDSVVFAGATSTPANWMRAIDVYVIPSRSEAFSNSLLEAMACGCCPIGSDVGGTSELIRHGEAGFLFESNKEAELVSYMRTLATNSELRDRMGRSAQQRVQSLYSIDISAKQLATIYRTVQGRPLQVHANNASVISEPIVNSVKAEKC